ncbi:hypothetical protein [Bryobacter aggregatus]|uniref:hypothetical protein n=1 Tax=Bryobacter aggregatus TaxID=360054 RepID=UPI0004E13658|nr:hypothetical protein [Bryobacter aggregatus]
MHTGLELSFEPGFGFEAAKILRENAPAKHHPNTSMKHIRLLYLCCFLAPVAFLCGYIAGAPRYIPPELNFNRIDPRPIPVARPDIFQPETSLLPDDPPWLQPNK